MILCVLLSSIFLHDPFTHMVNFVFIYCLPQNYIHLVDRNHQVFTIECLVFSTGLGAWHEEVAESILVEILKKKSIHFLPSSSFPSFLAVSWESWEIMEMLGDSQGFQNCVCWVACAVGPFQAIISTVVEHTSRLWPCVPTHIYSKLKWRTCHVYKFFVWLVPAFFFLYISILSPTNWSLIVQENVDQIKCRLQNSAFLLFVIKLLITPSQIS